jgi:hypothetical protein
MLEVYINPAMVAEVGDETLIQKYNQLHECAINNPNNWERRDRHDNTTPIYWFMKTIKYILDTIGDHDPQIKCKYISILFRIILQYRFILQQRQWDKFKAKSIQKAHDLREDAGCTDECKQTLNLFLNVVNV